MNVVATSCEEALPLPISDAQFRDRVKRVASLLHHAAHLAALAADGTSPELGAEYLINTTTDVSADLAFLRAVLGAPA